MITVRQTAGRLAREWLMQTVRLEAGRWSGRLNVRVLLRAPVVLPSGLGALRYSIFRAILLVTVPVLAWCLNRV